jgi:hypothetical protein
VGWLVGWLGFGFYGVFDKRGVWWGAIPVTGGPFEASNK